MDTSWKTVRIFISSTFRDMHAERDHLVRFVFPELKERCRKLRIQLIDVDLRWGVTEKDANAGKALDICLDEIDTCRPYFLGLLGFRYGYIPAGYQHSITAHEIYHGVLRTDIPKQVPDLRKIIEGKLEGKTLSNEETNCLARCYQWDADKAKYLLRVDVSADEEQILRSVFQRYSTYQKDRSYFFFRSEALTHQLAGNHPEDFFEEDPQKLLDLKKEILASGLPVFEYNDLETFGQLVRDALRARIDAEAALPLEGKDWLEQETDFHELFMADRTRRFVGRRDLLDRMQSFSERTDEPSLLVITGEPGSGKSALMSRFAEEIIRQHPDWLIIPHFVGASPASTSLRRMLYRFCTQLTRAIGSDEEIREDLQELLKLFPELLAKADPDRKMLFIIDAVNQLEEADDARRMNWLPLHLPANVRFVISTLEGKAQDSLHARRPQEEKLHGLLPDEIRQLVKTYLTEIRHEFPNDQVEAEFFNKVEHGNPLYILVALEELRIFAKFEELEYRIQRLPGNVPDLFGQVLDRLESDFNQPLIRDCTSYIACGRYGMTAEELQALLKNHAPSLDPGVEPAKLPDLLWSRLYRSFSSYLFERSGIIDFFHGQLKEAVGKRYLQNETDRKGVHQIIAQYFEKRWQEPYVRALDELPHQLTKAEDSIGLERILCDLEFIEAKCAAGMAYELVRDYGQLGLTLTGSPFTTKPFTKQLSPTIREFADFLQRQAYILEQYPQITFQQAYNWPNSSSVYRLAKDRIDSRKESGAWVCWINKPVRTDSCLMTLKPGSGSGCIISPGGDHFAFAVGKVIKIWNLESMLEVASLEAHTDDVLALAYSHAGNEIASTSSDKTIKRWDSQTGPLLTTALCNDIPTACAYSYDGKLIIVGFNNGHFGIVKAFRDGSITLLPWGHLGRVNSCRCSSDGKYILSGSDDKTLQLWNTGLEPVSKLHEQITVSDCKFSPDGSHIVATGHPDPSFRIWNTNIHAEPTTVYVQPGSENSAHTPGGHGGVECCDYSPDGKRIVVGCWDGSLRIWDTEKLVELAILKGHGEPIVACGYSPNGRWILSRTKDGTIKLFDAQNEDSSYELEMHTGLVDRVQFSISGTYARSTSWDKNLKIWDLTNGKCVSTVARDNKADEVTDKFGPWSDKQSSSTSPTIKRKVYSPDVTRRAEFGPTTKAIKLYDEKSGLLIRTLDEPEIENKKLVGLTSLLGCTCCAFSADSRYLITASDNKTMKIWNADNGSLLTVFPTRAVVSALLTNHRGEEILAGDATGNVYILKVQRPA